MKKYLLTLLFCLNASPCLAEDPYLTEVKALGSVAGQGLACQAAKYETYEMLARAILITKAYNNSEQALGMQLYNEEKANSYMSKKMDGLYNCREIAARFNGQDIFKITLYADGTIKMPNGKIFTPRTPYDATLVYNKNDNEKNKAQNIYNKGNNKKFVKTEIRDANTPPSTVARIEK